MLVSIQIQFFRILAYPSPNRDAIITLLTIVTAVTGTMNVKRVQRGWWENE